MHIYAADYKDKLPRLVGVGNWVWEPAAICGRSDAFERHSAARDVRPRFPAQDTDELWNFSLNANPALGFRVIGYAMTFPGTATLTATNENPSMIPQAIKYVTIMLPAPSPSDRVMMACATVSKPGQANLVESSRELIHGNSGGWSKLHQAAHLGNGGIPTGGNVVMLDGSSYLGPNNQQPGSYSVTYPSYNSHRSHLLCSTCISMD